jgi:hypothetical protein
MQYWAMDWIESAHRVPLTINFGTGRSGMRHPIYGLVLHVTDGHPNFGGLRSTWSHETNHVSAHFAIAQDGRLAQFVSLRDTAFAVGGDHQQNDDQHWFSVENVAHRGEVLTPAQIETNARLFLWFNKYFGVPLQLAETRDSFGLGYHSMFHRAHPSCPGHRVIAQRSDILLRVQGLL